MSHSHSQWYGAFALLPLLSRVITPVYAIETVTTSCSNVLIDALANPSFETGDLTGWTVSSGAINRRLDPAVVSGDAADGNYYL